MQNQLHRYYLFVLLKDMSFFAATLVPFFTVWGGIPQSQVQMIQSWFMFWFFIMEVPTGAVADYLGRKYSLALGALTVALAAAVYGSVPHLYVFLFSEFLFAIAMALISGADQAWLYDTLKENGQEGESEKVFGRAESLHLFALLVSASIGGLIAARFGLNAPMLFSALPYLLAAVVGMSLREPKIHSGPSESRRYVDIIKDGLKYLYTHPQLKALALDATIVTTAAYFVIWLYQPLLMEHGVPVAWLGFIHSGLLVTEMIIAHHFAWLSKVTHKILPYEKVAALLTSLGFLAAALFPSLYTALLFIVLAGGFGLTRFTYLSTKMNPLVESDKRATVLSAISMLRRFALVIVNPLFGVLADQSLRLTFGILGLLPLLALVFKHERRSPEKN